RGPQSSSPSPPSRSRRQNGARQSSRPRRADHRARSADRSARWRISCSTSPRGARASFAPGEHGAPPMNYAIVEDESPPSERLRSAMQALAPTAPMSLHLRSVAGALGAAEALAGVDLILSDVQLGDGSSFEIFECLDLRAPVIFCTAYDEYVTRA